MATINDVYTHLKTLTKKWFYDKTEIDNKLEGNAQENIAGKVDKISGKGLSANDYTTTEKNKLANIEAQANKTVVDSALSTASSNPVQNSAVATAINGKAPTSHASATNTYGLGTASNYGHVKTINELTQSSHVDGTALSAYQGKVLNDAISNKVDKISGKGLSTNDFTTAYKNKIDQIDEDLSSINLDWDNVTNKPQSFTPSTHNHGASDILENDNTDYTFLTVSAGATQHNINLDIDSALNALDGAIDDISTDWNDITNKPSTFTPSTHSHGAVTADGCITNPSQDTLGFVMGIVNPTTANGSNCLRVSNSLSASIIKDSQAHTNIGSSANAAQSTINTNIDTALSNKSDTSHTHSQYLTSHQDITGKANQSDLAALTSRVSALETSEFQIVFKSSKSALPATGRANTLYYVSNNDSGNENTYDEYTWVASESRYELMGAKSIDLSGYLLTSNLLNEIDNILTSLINVRETPTPPTEPDDPIII